MVFARFIFTPISRIFFAFERQREALLLDLFRVILVVVSFMSAKFFDLSSYGAVALFTIAMSSVYLITYILSQRILNEEIKKKEMKGEI